MYELWSNEQPFQVGPGPVSPKLSLVQVFGGDEASGKVTLSTGSLNGSAVGDSYLVARGKGHWFELTVVDVDLGTSTATAVLRGPATEDVDVTRFPSNGDEAELALSKDATQQAIAPEPAPRGLPESSTAVAPAR